jgi:exopolyphosphatase/guanosine-5'-triphosphate,3'-diphosphate pyrophosphatase
MIACDLGSNTLSIIEIDCVSKEKVNEYEKIVKTADGLVKNSLISDEAVARIVEAINEAKEIMDFQSNRTYSVATAALRLAKNSDEVILKIFEKTGLKFLIIDAKEEALYTSFGVENRLKILNYKTEEYLLIDIGGGSTEIIFQFDDEKISRSFNKGIVTISQKYENCHELEKNLDAELFELNDFVQKIYKDRYKPKLFVATSGTPTTIAAFYKGLDYEHYDENLINGVVINKEILFESYQSYLKMNFSQRGRWFGKGREDSMCGGFLILRKILDICNYKDIIVVDDGLKQGVALSKC